VIGTRHGHFVISFVQNVVVEDDVELARLPGMVELYRAGLALVRGEISATVQHAQQAIDVLLAKLEAAARAHGARALALGGGVACNRALRQGLASLGARLGVPAFHPSPRLCADNGAMIALVGALRLSSAGATDLAFSVKPRWDLASLSAP
jgi:N6-L-threonylcarbamoyladenine synthase